MVKKFLLLFAVLGLAATGFAQEGETLDLGPHFVNLIGAFVPVIAYVAVFFVRKYMKMIPKAILPMIPPILGLVVGIINGQVDGAANALIAAAWGGLATVVFEIQKGLQKAASGK